MAETKENKMSMEEFNNMTLSKHTALVVGATSGIGEGIARHLATMKIKNLIFAGRNEQAANKIIEEIKQVHPDGQFEFKKIDLTSLKEAARFAKEFEETHKQLNYLIITSGIMRTGGREETVEGLDDKMAVHYYGRFTLISQLLPLLEGTAEKGEDAKVMSVLGAGAGKLDYNDDLELKNHYGLIECANACTFYNDCMVQDMAENHPTVSFFHVAPGFVATNLEQNLPFYLKYAVKLIKPLGTSIEQCGNNLMYGFLAYPERKTGAWLMSQKGDHMQPQKTQTPQMRKTIWDHSHQVMNRILFPQEM